jgi:homoserine O-acetyltransferase
MRLSVSVLISVVILCVAVSITSAQSQNPAAKIWQRSNEIQLNYPGQTHGQFLVRNFGFSSGEVLPEARLSYFTLGTPHRNGAGQIDNAVLLLHGTADGGNSFLRPSFTDTLFGPGQALDLQKFYVVIPDILGHGQSSKPSDGLHARFPHYTYDDMVAGEYRLVTEKLGIKHLRLVLGTSMGGMHVFLWGERYPSVTDGLVAISALPVEIAGRNRMWRRLVIESIRNDPEWKNGEYVQQPHGYARVAPIIQMMVRSPANLYALYPTREAVDRWYEGVVEDAYAHTDANDRLYQYESSRSYNPAPELNKISARMLVIVFADDQINSPQFAVLDQQMPRIKHGRYVIVPVSEQSDGERNNLHGAIWDLYLRDFVASLAPP